MRVEIKRIVADDPVLAHLGGYDIIAASDQIWVGSIDHFVVAVWGLIPRSLLSDEAHLWSWMTPMARFHTTTILRQSRRMVAEMLADYPRLVGICTGNRRWLAWLGAEFGPPIEGYPSFTIKADHG